jgi:hypothetical protein
VESGRAGIVPGLGRPVGGIVAHRGDTAAERGFKVIKHGGFERFLLETLCAQAG